MKLDFSKNSGNFELVIWTIYYLLMFTIGRYELLKQPIIWVGGGLVFALTTPFIYRNFKKISREVLWLIALWFWSLTGGFVAINIDGYLHYVRMIAQMIMIIIFFGTVCRKTSYLNLFVGALIIPPLFIFGDMLVNSQAKQVIVDLEMQASTDRLSGLADDPNAFGIMCCVGIWAALKLITETKKLKALNVLLYGVIVVLIYAILLSASRSAFLVCIAEITAWLVFILPKKVPIHGLRLLIICLLVLLLLLGVEWVFENTFLGARSNRAIENTSEESRVQLIILGIELFLASPLIGHGLAQFVELSPTQHYSHNDLIELLATTGLPGAFFYYVFYFCIILVIIKILKSNCEKSLQQSVIMLTILLLMFLLSGMFSVNFTSMEWSFWVAMIIGSVKKYSQAIAIGEK